MHNKANTSEDLQSLVTSLSSKLRGIAFLFSRLQADSENDREAFSGIAEMLGDLADQSNEVKALVEQMRPASGGSRKAPAQKGARREEEATSVISVSSAAENV